MADEREMTPEELLAQQEAEAAKAEQAEKEAQAAEEAERAKQRREAKEAERKRIAEARAKQAEEQAAKEAAAKEAAKQQAIEADRKTAEEAQKKVDLDAQAQATQPKIIIVRPAVRKAAPTVSAKRAAVVTAIQNEVSENLSMHTPAGRALIRKFDEYTEICKSVRKNNQGDIAKCAKKLYEIVVDCCPHRGSINASYYRELIMIVYNRLTKGYGTLFTDAKLFRGDYCLPTPADAMKFDTFWTVMYQLVEASKTGAKITFNSKTVGNILKSPSAMAVINQIRNRIESAHE